MIVNFKLLHQDVGLKLDEKVFFGINDVEKALLKYAKLFEDVDVSSIDNSHMLYGYNSLENPLKLGFESDLIRRIIIFTKPDYRQRYKCVISYDGHNYNGFQIQKDQPTIQGELTRVISAVNGFHTLVQGASRTDTGVHALNYVFHFDSDRSLTKDKWFEYLNYQLPNDILVKSVKEVHPLFHSRYDVYKKRYIYKIILNERTPFKINYEWYIKELNTDTLLKNLKQLIGTYDFTSFCKGQPDTTVRTIYKTDLIKHDKELILVFEGNGFLRYMIRILVYALVQISNGKLDLNIQEIIKEKSREHTKNLAPACGLYLEEITY
jgi:tRNA pseudouridine38-40 synthase